MVNGETQLYIPDLREFMKINNFLVYCVDVS